MSKSVFKGELIAGHISSVFTADVSNQGSTLLNMSYAETGGGNPQTSHDTAVPGGVARAALDVRRNGILEVWVVAETDDESGRLSVSRNGVVADDEATKGSVRWVYSVASA